jgi:hypothetical protein
MGGELRHSQRTICTCRYVSASEASYQLVGGRLHHQKPNVYRLLTHLPGEQATYFVPDPNAPDGVPVQVPDEPITPLTAWFQSNIIHPDGRHLTYPDYCQEYKYMYENPRHWEPRQRQQSTLTVGRMYTVSHLQGER